MKQSKHHTTLVKKERTVRSCSICKMPFHGWGHNPEPIMPYEQRCCDNCNSGVVIPIRMFGVQHREAKAALARYGFVLVPGKPK